MLRKIIKKLIPSKNTIFLQLFAEGSENVLVASNLLADIINNVDSEQSETLSKELKGTRKKAVDINAEVTNQLNTHFITPIDRGDILHISTSLLQLTKRIIKINKKLQVYAIDATMDDCLVRSVNTLQLITESVHNMVLALKNDDHQTMQEEGLKADELDDNVIDDLGHAMKEISEADYDNLTIIKIKEVYKAIESAIDTSAYLCDILSSVSVKAI